MQLLTPLFPSHLSYVTFVKATRCLCLMMASGWLAIASPGVSDAAISVAPKTTRDAVSNMLPVRTHQAGVLAEEHDQMIKTLPAHAPYSVDQLHVRIHVNADGSAVVEKRVGIAIHHESAVEGLSRQSELYSASLDTLDILQAWTTKPDGERIFVQPQAIQDVDAHVGQFGIYSDQKYKVVVFPNVEAGSFLFRHSRQQLRTPIFPGQFMYSQAFYPDVIYRDVLIELTHDEAITVYVDTREMADESELTSDGQVRTYRYRYHREQPAQFETTSIDWVDLMPYFHASTFESVGRLGQQYAASAREAERPTEQIAYLARQIIEGIDDPLDQVKALYEWVTREIRYVGIYLRDATVVPNKAEVVLQRRYGDCKDHNTLLVSLLKSVGVEAEAALVNNGKSYELPNIGVMSNLNHVITYVPQWQLFLDSTERMTPFGVLPRSVSDKPSVLVREGKIIRTPRTRSEANWIHNHVDIHMHSDGSIRGQARSELAGSSSLDVRRMLANDRGQSRSETVRQWLASYMHPGEGEFEISGLWELANPARFNMSFELEPITNYPGEGAFSLPGGLAPGGLVELALESARVLVADPTLPVPCDSFQIVETFDIRLPDNATLTRIPDDVYYEDGPILYGAHYLREDNGLHAHRHLVIDLPSNVCQPTDLRRIHQVLAVLKRDLREQIFYRSGQ